MNFKNKIGRFFGFNASANRDNLTLAELTNLIGASGIGLSGALVSESTAMRTSAVYACVSLIAGAISTLPMDIYKGTARQREEVENDLWWLLNREPNADMSAAVFWEYLVSSRLFYGDAYAEIIRPSFRSNKITAIVPHHPLRVYPFRDGAGQLFYRITPLVGAQYVLNPADILHIPSLGYDGLTSPSPITYAAKEAVATALASEEHSSRFFSNGARPDFALTSKENTLTYDQAMLIRQTWMDQHGGVGKSHLPAVLTGGLEVKQLSLSSADAQILETAKWSLEQICRVLAVPPHMVGHTEKTTSFGSGVSAMSINFVKYTLKRDLDKIQQEINRKAFSRTDKMFVEFDISDIERGDEKSENEALRIALGRAGEPGWLTQNEVRQAKKRPPMPNGDELLELQAAAGKGNVTTPETVTGE